MAAAALAVATTVALALNATDPEEDDDVAEVEQEADEMMQAADEEEDDFDDLSTVESNDLCETRRKAMVNNKKDYMKWCLENGHGDQLTAENDDVDYENANVTVFKTYLCWKKDKGDGTIATAKHIGTFKCALVYGAKKAEKTNPPPSCVTRVEPRKTFREVCNMKS